ncbi:MAG: TonB-dependent receptor [Campylobacterales bacterium]|nr:TonB-dependent receptor [Campylobacterales bacterium]
MKSAILLSLAATLALASEPVTIQKITVEADSSKTDAQSVSADEMVKFSRQSDLGEMLSNTLPEITLVRNSGVGNDIILRGFRKDNLNITIDDAKVCGACPNRMDPPSMHVSSSQIKSVEVQEGPFDVTKFGSLGGKINVVTKDPQKGVHGEVSATLGSFDYRKLSTTLEGGNDAVQAQVGFSRETSGQYKDGNGRTLTEQTSHLLGSPTNSQAFKPANKNMSAYDRNNYWAKIVGKIGDNQKLTLSYFGDRADNVLYPRYPMDAQIDDTDMFKGKYQFFNLSRFSDELKIEGYHSKVKHVMGTDFRIGMVGKPVMVAPVEATIQGASVENTLTLSGAKVAVGVDTSLRNWNGTKGPASNPALNIMLPDVDTKNIALYAKGLKTIGNYEISSGVRYDDTTINPNQGLAAADPLALNKTFLTNMKDRSYNDVSANLLAKYNYTAHTNVFLGAGQSIRVPDAKELYWVASGNTNLNETKNREIDVGAEHTSGNFHLKGTAFYSDLKDFIYAYQTSTTTSTWANIDATIVGVDLHGDYLLGNEWRLEAGAAYQKGSKKDPSQLSATQTNKNLAEIPPLKGRAALVFDDTAHYAMAEWIAASHQTIDSNNGEKEIAGYALLNLKYGAELGKGFSLSTGINNFFNRTYALNNSYIGNQLITSSGTAPLVLNEPGRNFYATLGYKF